MKTIEIKGKEYQYQVYNSTSSHDITEFFLGVREYTRRKYWLFGEKVIKKEPIKVFTVYFDIETEFMTKKQIRNVLYKKIKILERQEEIKNNKII